MFSPVYRITAGVSAFVFLMGAAPSFAQQLDLNDFLAPVQGGSTAVNGPIDDGETVHAKTMQDGMNYAQQMLNDQDEDGIRVVSTASGIGTISRASANYSVYANPNATLLSKRTAYAEAYMAAKKQLIANLNPIRNTCNIVLESDLVALDTGMDSAANVNRKSSDICGEAVSGMLAAYVVYDVNDDTDNREVSISIATSTKTRNAFLRLNPAIIRSTDPNAAFAYVMNEITNYATPPIGAKLITHPETGEQIVIGFGSSIIRQNNNSTVAKKLKKMSRDQSGIRARNALVAFLRGDDLYWRGGFDENQIESTEQFVIPVDEQGNVGDPQLLNQDRDIFLNTISMSDSYEAVTSGQVPEGVQTKSFESADGNWYFSVAVFSQSARAMAQNTAQENNAAVNAIDATPTPLIKPQPSNSSGMIMEGGVLENGANPQGPSGQVSDSNDF